MKKNRVNNKMYLTFGVICLVFLLILGRIIVIQLVHGEEYRHGAENILVKEIPDVPSRGIIYDRNMNQLTSNVKEYSFWITDKDINYNNLDADEKADFKKELNQIDEVVDIDVDWILGISTEDYGAVSIASGIDPELADKVAAQNHNWLAIHPVYKRHYTFDSLASHVIGFIDSQGRGVSGIELSDDQNLAGVIGKKFTKTDLFNNEFALQDVVKYQAVEGTNDVLTIDTVVQQYLQNALEKAIKDYEAKRATAIVTNVKTGEIVAMGSYPTYDLNHRGELIGVDTSQMSEDEQIQAWYREWNNPAIFNTYEPGSVSKLVTVAAALEEGTINENSTFTCDGKIQVADTELHCWVYPQGHDTLDVRGALVHSCNVALIKIMNTIGEDKYMNYFESLNLPYRTGIELEGETYPITLPRDKIGQVELATMSFGHAYSVTPLQMITAVNAIVNDGKLMKPYIISKRLDKNGKVIFEKQPEEIRQVFSKDTSDLMKSMMKSVSESYQGEMSYDYFNGIEHGSKTGTAVLFDEESEEYGEEEVTSMYIAAPIDDPIYSVLVVVNRPQKSSSTFSAGVAAKEILVNLFEYEGANIAGNSGSVETVPSVEGLSVDEAISVLEDSGYGYSLTNYEEGKDYIVSGQYPKTGNLITRGAKIILNLKEASEVPESEEIEETQEDIEETE